MKRHSAARPFASHLFGQVRGKRRGSQPVRIIAVVCVTPFEQYPKHAAQRESLTLSLDTTLPFSRPKTSIFGTSKQLTAVSSTLFTFQVRLSNIEASFVRRGLNSTSSVAFVNFRNSGSRAVLKMFSTVQEYPSWRLFHVLWCYSVDNIGERQRVLLLAQSRMVIQYWRNSFCCNGATQWCQCLVKLRIMSAVTGTVDGTSGAECHTHPVFTCKQGFSTEADVPAGSIFWRASGEVGKLTTPSLRRHHARNWCDDCTRQCADTARIALPVVQGSSVVSAEDLH